MNKEQKEFAISIAKRLESIVTINSCDQICINGINYTYEEFVGEFFDLGKDSQIGMLKIVDGVIKVLLPTKDGNVWMSHSSMQHMDNHSGFTVKQEYKETDALYGITNLNNGYFSPYGRVKLYDRSWKKVELSMEDIAKKFGIKPEQIRIKK